MTDYKISLDNYVKDKYSICREERQYALYLCNILRYYGDPKRREKADKEVQIIFKNCGFSEGDKIENVFYEATFMRDFLERSRRINLDEHCNDINQRCLRREFKPSTYKDLYGNSFNRRLIDYVTKYYKKKNKIEIRYDPEKVEEKNYGHNVIPVFDDLNDHIDKEHVESIKLLIKAMMNAKPDLAAVYSHGRSSKYLLFLECKFESGEDKYLVKQDKAEGEKKAGYTQRQVQWHIANYLTTNDFLKYGNDGEKLEISPLMKSEPSLLKDGLVKFCRCLEDDSISIESLIRIESAIFQ